MKTKQTLFIIIGALIAAAAIAIIILGSICLYSRSDEWKQRVCAHSYVVGMSMLSLGLVTLLLIVIIFIICICCVYAATQALAS